MIKSHLNDDRRHHIITASQAYDAIYNRKRLWREKTLRAEPFEGNDATRWGNSNEPHALMMLEDQLNTVLGDGDKLYVHPTEPLGASPDGFYVQQSMTGEKVKDYVVEVKCPYSMELYKRIPENYWFQMQVQMYVCNKEKALFYVWTPEDQSLDEVDFNPTFIEWYLPLARAFVEFVQTDVEPPRWTKAPRFDQSIL